MDLRFLALLKSPKWQASVAATCGGLLALKHQGLIREWEAWIETFVWAAFIFCTFLVALELSERFYGSFLKPMWHSRRLEKEVLRNIRELTHEEIKVIVYCLATDTPCFEADATGGRASRLCGRGWVVPELAKGQHFYYDTVPWRIHPRVWKVLHKHREEILESPFSESTQETA